MIVSSDPRLKIEFHSETVGCKFDFCEVPEDIVVSLKKAISILKSAGEIKDQAQLMAIADVWALEFSEDQRAARLHKDAQ